MDEISLFDSSPFCVWRGEDKALLSLPSGLLLRWGNQTLFIEWKYERVEDIAIPGAGDLVVRKGTIGEGTCQKV